jgi:glycosyltransferase involved in cell wall biosynthesis
MTVTPRVSVIIPLYNAEAYVGLAIESVLAQTFSAWELVVLDDGSTDGSVSVANRYAESDARIRVVQQTNGGVAAARNAGFAAASPASEYIIFFDNDDLWEPNALETLAGILDAHPEYVAAHGSARSIDSRGLPLAHDDLEEKLRDERRALVGRRVVAWTRDVPTTFAALAVHNCIVTPGVLLIRRAALEAVGGFDPATVPCDDWDLSLRLSRRGDIGYTDRILLNWRRHEINQSDRSSRWRDAYYGVRRKLIAAPENSPEQRRIAHLAYRYACLQNARRAWAALGGRQFREAMRNGLRAGYGMVQYLRAAGQP